MKAKKFTKALNLKKQTIVNLSDAEKASVNGGGDPTRLPGTCNTSAMTCHTWEMGCQTRFMQLC